YIPYKEDPKTKEKIEEITKATTEAKSKIEDKIENLNDDAKSAQDQLKQLLKTLGELRVNLAASRVSERAYWIPPSDILSIFFSETEDLIQLAITVADARATKLPRALDVRSYLRNELAAAYDVMSGRCSERFVPLANPEFIEDLIRLVDCRAFRDADPS